MFKLVDCWFSWDVESCRWVLWPCRDCHCSHIKVGCLQTKHSQIEQDFIDFLFQNEQDDLGQISPKEDSDEGFDPSTRDRQVDHTLVNSISDFTFDFLGRTLLSKRWFPFVVIPPTQSSSGSPTEGRRKDTGRIVGPTMATKKTLSTSTSPLLMNTRWMNVLISIFQYFSLHRLLPPICSRS